jgi:hypothetical protein
VSGREWCRCFRRRAAAGSHPARVSASRRNGELPVQRGAQECLPGCQTTVYSITPESGGVPTTSSFFPRRPRPHPVCGPAQTREGCARNNQNPTISPLTECICAVNTIFTRFSELSHIGHNSLVAAGLGSQGKGARRAGARSAGAGRASRAGGRSPAFPGRAVGARLPILRPCSARREAAPLGRTRVKKVRALRARGGDKKRAAGNPLSAGGSQGPLLLPKAEDIGKLGHVLGPCNRAGPPGPKNHPAGPPDFARA